MNFKRLRGLLFREHARTFSIWITCIKFLFPRFPTFLTKNMSKYKIKINRLGFRCSQHQKILQRRALKQQTCYIISFFFVHIFLSYISPFYDIIALAHPYFHLLRLSYARLIFERYVQQKKTRKMNIMDKMVIISVQETRQIKGFSRTLFLRCIRNCMKILTDVHTHDWNLSNIHTLQIFLRFLYKLFEL